MKKILKYIISVIIIALVALGVYIFITRDNKDIESDAVRFKEEYKDVANDNIFVYKSAEDIINILEGGTGIIYFGFSSCPWCQAYVPMLNDLAREKGIETIYYLDIKDIRNENTSEYQKIVELTKDFLPLNDEGKERIYVPDVFFVKEGIILGHNNETSLISGGTTPEEYWTVERKEALKTTLTELIMQYNGELCSSCN